MNIKITLTATRTDTSAEFWYTSNSTSSTYSTNLTTEMCNSLGIVHTTELSEDGLTLKKIFSNVTDISWGEFMASVFSLPELVYDRNVYFVNNNHSLSLTRVDVDTNTVVAEISDLIAFTNAPA